MKAIFLPFFLSCGICLASPFDDYMQGRETSTYTSSPDPKKQKQTKPTKKQSRYEYSFSAAGKDDAGRTCGRLVIKNLDTGETMGEFDYQSQLANTSPKVRDSFKVLFVNRDTGQPDEWTVEYIGNELRLSIPKKKFTDYVKREEWKTRETSNEELAAIRGSNQGDHAFLPPAASVAGSNNTGTQDMLTADLSPQQKAAANEKNKWIRGPFSHVGRLWACACEPEPGVLEETTFISLGKTKQGNIYGIEEIKITRGATILNYERNEFEVIGHDPDGFTLEGCPSKLFIQDEETLWYGKTKNRIFQRTAPDEAQLESLRRTTSYYKLGK